MWKKRDYVGGEHPFISFRRRDYAHAVRLKEWLERNGFSREAAVFPPDSLCEQDEVLTPRGMLELVEDIGQRLMRADAFFIIDAPDYTESYFTAAEMMQWCRRRDPKAFRAVAKPDGGFDIHEGTFPSLDEGLKDLLSKLSVNISKELRNPLIPLWGGRYADSHFVVPCDRCGRYSVVGRKTVIRSMDMRRSMPCPHCNQHHFTFRRGARRKASYQYAREPIILADRPEQRVFAPLDFWDLTSLFFSKKLPDSIKEAVLPG